MRARRAGAALSPAPMGATPAPGTALHHISWREGGRRLAQASPIKSQILPHNGLGNVLFRTQYLGANRNAIETRTFYRGKKKKKSIKTNERIQYAFLEQCPVVQVQYKLIVRRLRNLREVI